MGCSIAGAAVTAAGYELSELHQTIKNNALSVEYKSTKPKQLEAPKSNEQVKAKLKAGPAPKILQAKAGDGIFENTKNKRKSTHDKHTKRRPGGNEKKKRKPSWKKRK